MRRRGLSPTPSATSVPSTGTVEDECEIAGHGRGGCAEDGGIPIKPDAGGAEKDRDCEQRSAGMFECNICFETPRDPIVTRCGHLYCWGCVYRWMRQRAGGASQCPVCKAAISPETVVPIYGRGRTQSDDPRTQYPPRPPGQRNAPAQGVPGDANNGNGNNGTGLHPYWHPAAAFGRNVYAAGHGGNLALATFGNFPSLLEIAYPQLNEQTDNHPRLTPEQETREQVAKVFLFLALFIIGIITFF